MWSLFVIAVENVSNHKAVGRSHDQPCPDQLLQAKAARSNSGCKPLLARWFAEGMHTKNQTMQKKKRGGMASKRKFGSVSFGDRVAPMDECEEDNDFALEAALEESRKIMRQRKAQPIEEDDDEGLTPGASSSTHNTKAITADTIQQMIASAMKEAMSQMMTVQMAKPSVPVVEAAEPVSDLAEAVETTFDTFEAFCSVLCHLSLALCLFCVSQAPALMSSKKAKKNKEETSGKKSKKFGREE